MEWAYFYNNKLLMLKLGYIRLISSSNWLN